MAEKLEGDNGNGNNSEETKENEMQFNEDSQNQNDQIESATEDEEKNASNSFCSFQNADPEFISRILKKYKKFQIETGCTDEEIFELVNEIESQRNAEEETGFEFEEQDYGSAEYWENRYSICTESFDWYHKWDEINAELSKLFNGDELVLNIGCGNSEMSADMQKTTFDTVVSIDISAVVIKQMIEKYSDNKNLLWFEMDCTDMSFDDEMFDIVFDKGTFDAILCGPNSVENVYRSMDEIWRVMKFSGLFIEITYGTPQNRNDIFKHTGLSWKLYEPISILVSDEMRNDEDEDENERFHYIYIFQKLQNYEEEEESRENEVENNEANKEENKEINEEENKEINEEENKELNKEENETENKEINEEENKEANETKNKEENETENKETNEEENKEAKNEISES